jgi:transcriptional regulator with XRE-family HTH domain
MPVSVGRHNLARIRAQLKLTQADLGKLVRCSPASIKAVEIGKLALSDSLASRISHALGIDKEWLLKNDLTALLPARYSPPTQETASGDAAAALAGVLFELFSRLFAVVAKMEKNQYRAVLELNIAIEMDALKKLTKPIPDCLPSQHVWSNTIEFFLRQPDLFDPDLRQWVDLKGLLKSNLELSTPWSDTPDEIDERVKEIEESLQKALKIDREMNEEFQADPEKARKKYARLAEGSLLFNFSLEPQGEEGRALPLQRSPNQTPPSPSPAGRRKKKRSS